MKINTERWQEQGCGGAGNLIHCCWECQMQNDKASLKGSLEVLLIIYPPYDVLVHHLDIYVF